MLQIDAHYFNRCKSDVNVKFSSRSRIVLLPVVPPTLYRYILRLQEMSIAGRCLFVITIIVIHTQRVRILNDNKYEINDEDNHNRS